MYQKICVTILFIIAHKQNQLLETEVEINKLCELKETKDKWKTDTLKIIKLLTESKLLTFMHKT